jgi:hypothetical protein
MTTDLVGSASVPVMAQPGAPLRQMKIEFCASRMKLPRSIYLCHRLRVAKEVTATRFNFGQPSLSWVKSLSSHVPRVNSRIQLWLKSCLAEAKLPLVQSAASLKMLTRAAKT